MKKKSFMQPSENQHQHWHALHAEEAVAATESNADEGLSAEEAIRRIEHFGPNALPEATRCSLLLIFLGQFKSPLIYLLFAAAGIALLLTQIVDAAVIFSIVMINALVGAFQEGRAERSLEALRKLTTHKARVVRDKRDQIIEAHAIVPGDILVLNAGDVVVADARLLDGAALQIAEATLTGESLPVAKDLLPLASETPLADRKNMVYAGTHVTAGRARAVVVATGLATEIGHIATLAGSAEQPQTPLARRVAQFGRYIIYVAIALFVMIIAIGVLRGMPFGEIAMIGISAVVGMIPEGLPVAMTIALAVGVQRMARRKAVVRRLTAVETLGSITIICSDKTGTLTRNEMTVTILCQPNGREINVTGTGYKPTGQFLVNEHKVELHDEKELQELLEAAVLCNDAQLQGPDGSSPQWKPIGDPTEVAFLTLAIKGGIIPNELRTRWPRRAEIPFDATSKMMATQHDTLEGSRVIIKGAPEAVLNLCFTARHPQGDVPFNDTLRQAMHDAAQSMAERALRVLAIGVVDNAEIDGRSGFAPFQNKVTLIGLLGQMDPPRPEAKDAVACCRKAGIKPVMVTGDHKATGHAIAKSLGIAHEGDIAVDGRELDEMSDAALAESIDAITVFARVHPAQKLRIVDAYQKRHEIVAMTGDGVNDAPALAMADVGVAMGIAGTEVAKGSAQIILGDDNFATFVAAVEEGRVVHRNIKKAVLFLLSTSAAEVLVLLLAMLLGYPPPFAAVQILWNNLVTEGLVTVNLIMEPAEGDEMRQRPIAPDEPFLNRMLLTRMGFMVPAIVISTLGWFIARTAAGIPQAQVCTETFTLLAICEWYNVLNCRSEWKSALNLGVLKNPWLLGGLVIGNIFQIAVVFWQPLGRIFHTVPLSIKEFAVLFAVGSFVLWVEELRKLIMRRSHHF